MTSVSRNDVSYVKVMMAIWYALSSVVVLSERDKRCIVDIMYIRKYLDSETTPENALWAGLRRVGDPNRILFLICFQFQS